MKSRIFFYGCIMAALVAASIFDGKFSELWNVKSAWGDPQREMSDPAGTRIRSSEYSGLKKSIEITIEGETANVNRLEKLYIEAQEYEKTINARINAFNLRISAYSNLLISPVSSVMDIENARMEHRVSIDQINVILRDIGLKRESIARLLMQAEEQYSLNEKQLAEINIVSGTAAEIQSLVEVLQTVTRILSRKIQVLENKNSLYTELHEKITRIHKAFMEFTGKFDQLIAEKQKEAFFKRKYDPFVFINTAQLMDDFHVAIAQIHRISEKEFWLNQFIVVRGSGWLLLSSCVILFILIQILLFRMLKHLKIITEKYYTAKPESWLHIIMRLFYQSLPLLGTVLFIFIYAHARNLWYPIPLIRAVYYILVSWLLTSWAFSLIKLLTDYQKIKTNPDVIRKLQNLLYLVRYFAIFHIAMEWLIGFNNIILFFGRVVFEILLLSGCIGFWRNHRKQLESEESLAYLRGKRMFVMILLSYGIIVSGILMDLAGYGSLALYWYKSCGLSLILIMWCALLLLLIFEWNRGFKQLKADTPEEADTLTRTLRWFLVQMLWIVLIFSVLFGLLFAWGAKQTVFVGFFHVLSTPMSLGGINISAAGLIYAVIALLATHGMTRVWKHRLLDTFLKNSGFEPGIKNSITIITTYLLWAFGILLALSFAGINTTSLAVVFGALSIGLGFGLQNIFNNFISGLILLFERPIQVGDVVEINGTWGEIKKINVRSTLVQTYNNASLIIPNAEFISKQVINWSFKDPRVRRIITIGVSYDSDLQLVKKILLEAVDNVPEAYKYPAPNVVFADYGDSSLVFLVRFWTHIDTCLSAESDVRFEIKRLFKEHHIEIPFPQRDIHLFNHDHKAELTV